MLQGIALSSIRLTRSGIAQATTFPIDTQTLFPTAPLAFVGGFLMEQPTLSTSQMAPEMSTISKHASSITCQQVHHPQLSTWTIPQAHSLSLMAQGEHADCGLFQCFFHMGCRQYSSWISPGTRYLMIVVTPNFRGHCQSTGRPRAKGTHRW